jgi:hypothetical protein
VLPGTNPDEVIERTKYCPVPGKPPKGKAMVLPVDRSEGSVADATEVPFTAVFGVDGAKRDDHAVELVGGGIVNVPRVSLPVTAILTFDPGVKPRPVV